MKRRTLRGRSESSLPTPSPSQRARRKPEWNAYLTDDKQYKLNQEQQLQRALQQLSTAHFSARSPSMSASRRRLAAMSAHSSARNTPQDTGNRRERSTSCIRLSDVADTGELLTARRLQFADVSMDLEEPTPRRRVARSNTVSFNDTEGQEKRGSRIMKPQQKAQLQRELEVLEKMLWELETETKRLGRQQTPQKMQMQQQMTKSPGVKRPRSATKSNERVCSQSDVKENERQEKSDRVKSEDGKPEDASNAGVQEIHDEYDNVDAEERLEVLCYKSLEIGLELARQLETLKKHFNDERRRRTDRDLKIEMLEQEVRSTQAKCNYLESKYQNVASQVDDMREAVSITEENIQRMTLAFEYSQRRRGKASKKSTFHKPGSDHLDDVLPMSKVATPKKTTLPMENEENWTPND